MQKYRTVSDKFKAYFRRAQNVICQTVSFNPCHQKEGESVDDYMVALHELARECDFGEGKDRTIHERFMVGPCDKAMFQALQTNPLLMLETELVKARLKRDWCANKELWKRKVGF